jgi:hypothetical protein
MSARAAFTTKSGLRDVKKVRSDAAPSPVWWSPSVLSSKCLQPQVYKEKESSEEKMMIEMDGMREELAALKEKEAFYQKKLDEYMLDVQRRAEVEDNTIGAVKRELGSLEHELLDGKEREKQWRERYEALALDKHRQEEHEAQIRADARHVVAQQEEAWGLAIRTLTQAEAELRKDRARLQTALDAEKTLSRALSDRVEQLTAERVVRVERTAKLEAEHEVSVAEMLRVRSSEEADKMRSEELHRRMEDEARLCAAYKRGARSASPMSVRGLGASGLSGE